MKILPQMKMIWLLLAVFGAFTVIIFVSLRIHDHNIRQMFVGFLSCASLVSMFASPLFIIVGSLKRNPLFICHVLARLIFVFGIIDLNFYDFYACQNLVIRTKSVEYMPFYLSLATFVMSLSFFAYGLLKYDPFIYVSDILVLFSALFLDSLVVHDKLSFKQVN